MQTAKVLVLCYEDTLKMCLMAYTYQMARTYNRRFSGQITGDQEVVQVRSPLGPAVFFFLRLIMECFL